MIAVRNFAYPPSEHEGERASNSYLMSLVAVIAGLPLPIVNVIATLIFFLGNRKGSFFIRWHCTQALVSQLALIPFNSYMFWWTINIIFTNDDFTMNYGIALGAVALFNVVEMIGTIYAAIETRKGKHIHWCLYGDITDVLCKP